MTRTKKTFLAFGAVGVLAIAADPTRNLGKLILDTRSTAGALAALQDGAT